MKHSLPNLFASLFAFHPRDGHTPKENFLTESFAYVLQTDDGACDQWLSRILGKDVKKATCKVTTRQTEWDQDADTSIYPDLLLEGHLSNRERFAAYCEHKWDSHCDANQLRKYRKLAESKGQHARLIFVGANHIQRTEAAKCFPSNSRSCFLWEDVFYELNRLPVISPILKEFLEFMKTHGLSPAQPLTVEVMRAFLQSSDFLESLLNLGNKLNTEYSWEVIPKRFRKIVSVRDKYGRIGVRFETEDWRPALTVGFLYDETDHKVEFVNRDRGIDLLLRIEADPKDTKNIQPTLDVLTAKRKELEKTAASVLLKGEPGNGNSWSVLVVRDCLADVIDKTTTDSDQLAAIYKTLTGWLHVLFDDGTLEKGFKKTGLDSGMR